MKKFVNLLILFAAVSFTACSDTVETPDVVEVRSHNLEGVWKLEALSGTPLAENTYVYVLDPMLATGNSSVETINLFLKKGMKEENLTFVNLIASPQGIKNIRDRFKKIRIITAHIDEGLNEKGYIVPGLGDAGDRLFNTFN